VGAKVLGESDISSVRFSDSVTISNISDAHGRLSAALECGNSVVIDIADVTEADLTFAQLIEAARRSATERGRTIQLRNGAQGAVLQVLQRGGFLDPADPDRADFWLQGANQQ
jgi:MFS superfamily sulfate permease-like transporter